MEVLRKITDKKYRGLVAGIIFVIGLILDLVMMSGTVLSSRDSVWNTANYGWKIQIMMV